MSETVEVFKKNFIAVLESLAEKKPPKSSVGEMYLNRLINRIETSDSVNISTIVEHLACAGYSLSDVLKVFYDVGLLASNEDLVRYRDSVRRVMLHASCTE